jgi:hypothetical protein
VGFDIRAHFKNRDITKLYAGMKLKMLRVVLMTLMIAKEEPVNQPGRVMQFIRPLACPNFRHPHADSVSDCGWKDKKNIMNVLYFKRGSFSFFFLCIIQLCFICCPSELRTVGTFT